MIKVYEGTVKGILERSRAERERTRLNMASRLDHGRAIFDRENSRGQRIEKT